MVWQCGYSRVMERRVVRVIYSASRRHEKDFETSTVDQAAIETRESDRSKHT